MGVQAGSGRGAGWAACNTRMAVREADPDNCFRRFASDGSLGRSFERLIYMNLIFIPSII